MAVGWWRHSVRQRITTRAILKVRIWSPLPHGRRRSSRFVGRTSAHRMTSHSGLGCRQPVHGRRDPHSTTIAISGCGDRLQGLRGQMMSRILISQRGTTGAQSWCDRVPERGSTSGRACRESQSTAPWGSMIGCNYNWKLITTAIMSTFILNIYFSKLKCFLSYFLLFNTPSFIFTFLLKSLLRVHVYCYG